MFSAGFSATPAEVGPGAVTTYVLTAGDDLAPAPAQACAIPAADGLWASAGDLMRLAPAGRRCCRPRWPAPRSPRTGLPVPVASATDWAG
jgi:hypothetical protein